MPKAVSVVSAAKLHVLQLDPIKERVGSRWGRLSDLVHKLFEKALKQAQRPGDHFIQLGELSYVVTFHDLCVEEATLACAAVAKSVCELLFGADVNDTAVRGLIGTVPQSLLDAVMPDSGLIGEMLERGGREIVIAPELECSASPASVNRTLIDKPFLRPVGWIRTAHERASFIGRTVGFAPIWDLKRRTSASLFLSMTPDLDRKYLSIRQALENASEGYVVDTEIALLNAGAVYCHRVDSAKRVCAVGVGVRYQTLSCVHSRLSYVNALKALLTVRSCPLLLRIEQVPSGMPMSRLAEMITLLTVPNVRVTIEFETLAYLPEFDIRLGAVGFGGSLKSCDSVLASAMIHRLVRRATSQRAFVVLRDIDSKEHLEITLQNNVQFGSGTAVSSKCVFTGEEPIPEFPLHS